MLWKKWWALTPSTLLSQPTLGLRGGGVFLHLTQQTAKHAFDSMDSWIYDGLYLGKS